MLEGARTRKRNFNGRWQTYIVDLPYLCWMIAVTRQVRLLVGHTTSSEAGVQPDLLRNPRHCTAEHSPLLRN